MTKASSGDVEFLLGAQEFGEVLRGIERACGPFRAIVRERGVGRFLDAMSPECWPAGTMTHLTWQSDDDLSWGDVTVIERGMLSLYTPRLAGDTLSSGRVSARFVWANERGEAQRNPELAARFSAASKVVRESTPHAVLGIFAGGERVLQPGLFCSRWAAQWWTQGHQLRRCILPNLPLEPRGHRA